MLHFDVIPEPVRDALSRLVASPALEGFALAGGTSLALRFGHRVSVGLDFFTRDAFDPGSLRGSLPLEATEVARTEGSLTLDAGGTKLDFLRHDYPLLGPVESLDGVRLMSVRDVSAMKLYAIANRGSKKDFYDLVTLLDRLPLAELLEAFEEKYENSDRFVVLRSLAWFEDAEAEPDPVSLTGVKWTDVKRAIGAAIRRV